MENVKACADRGWESAPDLPDFFREMIDRAAKVGNTGPAVFGYRMCRPDGSVHGQTITDLSTARPPELFDEFQWILNALAEPEVRRVEVVFERLNDDITLPQFRLAR